MTARTTMGTSDERPAAESDPRRMQWFEVEKAALNGDLYAASDLVAALRWYRDGAQRLRDGLHAEAILGAIRLAEESMDQGYRRLTERRK